MAMQGAQSPHQIEVFIRDLTMGPMVPAGFAARRRLRPYIGVGVNGLPGTRRYTSPLGGWKLGTPLQFNGALKIMCNATTDVLRIELWSKRFLARDLLIASGTMPLIDLMGGASPNSLQAIDRFVPLYYEQGARGGMAAGSEMAGQQATPQNVGVIHVVVRRDVTPSIMSSQQAAAAGVPVAAAAQGVQPNVVQQPGVQPAMQPGVGQQGAPPIVAAQGAQPALGQQGVQPNLAQQGMKPALGQQGVQPNLAQPGIQPNLMQQGVQPNLAAQGVQPNLMQPNLAQPNLGQQGIVPNMANQGMQPNLPQQGMQPGFAQQEMQGVQPQGMTSLSQQPVQNFPPSGMSNVPQQAMGAQAAQAFPASQNVIPQQPMMPLKQELLGQPMQQGMMSNQATTGSMPTGISSNDTSLAGGGFVPSGAAGGVNAPLLPQMNQPFGGQQLGQQPFGGIPAVTQGGMYQ